MKSMLILVLALLTSAPPMYPAPSPAQALADYQAELAACRQAHGGRHDLPDVKFFLFGMGARTKLIYQTKGLKFGLRALGLPDPYVVPKVADGYSALFWMDYRDQHTPGRDADDRGNYPYLGWACDHFHGSSKAR